MSDQPINTALHKRVLFTDLKRNRPIAAKVGMAAKKKPQASAQRYQPEPGYCGNERTIKRFRKTGRSVYRRDRNQADESSTEDA